MHKRLEEMSDLVTANLKRAQAKQKQTYDKRVQVQPLEVGDEVLVLNPTRQRKLQLQWTGPYQIVRKVTPVDFEVEMPGRRQERKIYHANLLKKWHPQKGTQVLMALHHIDPPEQAVIDTDGDESQYLLETGEPVTVPLDYQSLTPDQVAELQELLHKFPELTSDKLGRTDVLEHDVNVRDAPPIRQQPYQVPLAMRDTMERELGQDVETWSNSTLFKSLGLSSCIG